MPESVTQKQVRLILERQCREYAELLKSKVPAGVGFALWLTDFGADGNMAYVSTCDRDDMIKLVQEWLDANDVNHQAEGWQAAVTFILRVAETIGLEGPLDPYRILERCRELKASEKR